MAAMTTMETELLTTLIRMMITIVFLIQTIVPHWILMAMALTMNLTLTMMEMD